MDPQAPNNQNNDTPTTEPAPAAPVAPEATSPFAQELPDSSPATPALTPESQVVTNAPEAVAAPATAPFEQPAAAPQAVPIAAPAQAAITADNSAKKGLGLWALILGILSVVLGLLWPVAAILAIVAIILGIVGLVKHHGAKGKLTAGLIIGGVSLVVLIPIWFFVSMVALAGLQEAARSVETQSGSSLQSEVQSL